MTKKRRDEPTYGPGPKLVEVITKELTDRGLIIEAGWVGLKMRWIHPDTPPGPVDELRNAFFAGAKHLFDSIVVVLEPGAEPTDKDLKRFELINDELEKFFEDYVKRKIPTEGSA